MSKETSTKKTPSLIAYSVKEGANDQSYFNRIGAAFPNGEGKGITVLLDSVPLSGKIVLLPPKEKE